jgi:uncharacterized protein
MTPISSKLNRALTQVLMWPIRGYRLLLSPWLGSACRFNPTCSAYALQALEEHGAGQGSYLAARRILRCHPWCAGGHDPVPTAQVADLVSPETYIPKKST